MSPGDSAEGGRLRQQYSAELEQLALQVEMMGVLVDQNLERMREVLRHGDEALAAEAIGADDQIDAMNLSLMERCYELLRREAPVATDLRLIVSVLRVTAEFERIGDLALRVVKLQPDHALLTTVPRAFDVLQTMCDHSIDAYREALRAWSAHDLALAERVAAEPSTGITVTQLVEALQEHCGADGVAITFRTMVAGQALDRISDHATVLGARVRYLITGDPAHLAAEVR